MGVHDFIGEKVEATEGPGKQLQPLCQEHTWQSHIIAVFPVNPTSRLAVTEKTALFELFWLLSAR